MGPANTAGNVDPETKPPVLRRITIKKKKKRKRHDAATANYNHSNNNDDIIAQREDQEAEVKAAMKQLQKGIDRYLRRFGPGSSQQQQQIETLLQHIHHVVTQLLYRRRSLQALVQFVQYEWTRCKQHLQQHDQKCQEESTSFSSSSSHLLQSVCLPILQHIFVLFVRCNDGFVLLTSGECRHPGDIPSPTKGKEEHPFFPSQLSSLAERGDGYTYLYQPDAHYSGYGWDEWANDTVGLQVRLNRLLSTAAAKKCDDPWSTHLEAWNATSLLEGWLDRHEQTVKNCQAELQAFKQQFQNDLPLMWSAMNDARRGTVVLPHKSLRFVTQDKMERLTWTVGSNSHTNKNQQMICLERRANQFQLSSGSVLPIEYQTMDDWKRTSSIQLVGGRGGGHVPSTSSEARKKPARRRIQDSDDDEDDQRDNGKENKKSAVSKKQEGPQVIQGLHVKVASSASTTAAANQSTPDEHHNNQSVSLQVIKAGLGFNAQGLQASMDCLVEEGKMSNEAAAMIDQEEQAKVDTCRRVYQRAKSRKTGVDPQEVWDARDCFRIALMQLGNHYLELEQEADNDDTTNDDDTSTLRLLDKALHSFEEAKRMATEQVGAHGTVATELGGETMDTRLMYRDALLQLGRATVNVGITLRIQSQHPRMKSKMSLLKRALQECDQTRGNAVTAATLARSEQSTQVSFGIGWTALQAEIIEATALECMARRNKGAAMWPFNRTDASKELKSTASMFLGAQMVCRVELVHSVLELAEECIATANQTMTMALAALEGLPRKDRSKGDVLLGLFEISVHRICEITKELETLKSEPTLHQEVELIMQEKNMGSVSEHLGYLSEIKDWWNNLQTQAGSLGDHAHQEAAAASLPRFASVGRSMIPPSSRVIVGGDIPIARRSKHRENSSGNRSRSSTGGTIAAMQAVTRNIQHQPTHFRKWGDELLPQIPDPKNPEKTTPVLPAVCRAPIMPPEVAAFFATS